MGGLRVRRGYVVTAWMGGRRFRGFQVVALLGGVVASAYLSWPGACPEAIQQRTQRYEAPDTMQECTLGYSLSRFVALSAM